MPDGKNTVTKPPEPKAPAALSKASADNAELNRRSFFSWLSFGWLGFVAATGGFFTMLLRFIFPNVLFFYFLSYFLGVTCLIPTSKTTIEKA